jgi:hypothetical protein
VAEIIYGTRQPPLALGWRFRSSLQLSSYLYPNVVYFSCV